MGSKRQSIFQKKQSNGLIDRHRILHVHAFLCKKSVQKKIGHIDTDIIALQTERTDSLEHREASLPSFTPPTRWRHRSEYQNGAVLLVKR